MRRCLLLLVLALASGAAHAQTATVRGFITGADDGEALQGVNVVATSAEGDVSGTVTDGNGIYAIARLTPGRYIVRASFIGYEAQVDTLALTAGEVRTFNIVLAPQETELQEVMVEAEAEGSAARLIAGAQTITPENIERVPTPDVSGDLATYLTTLPGIVTIGDQGGQLFIRGGEPSHNLVRLDGMTLLQPFHVLGFFSAFPTDIISRADVYAGGFGSRYSGRIASVIDVYSRNGNKRRWDGTASVGPFLSAAQVEGPIAKDQVSLLASVRHSVLDQGASRYIDRPLPFKFGDAFVKLHTVLNQNHQISLSGIYTYDRGAIGEPAPGRDLDEVRWRNGSYGLRYLFLAKDRPFFTEIQVSISRLNSTVGPEGDPVRTVDFTGFSYGVNMTYFLGGVDMNYGLFWRTSEFGAQLSGLYQNLSFDFNRRTKAGFYAEPDIYVAKGLLVRPGVVLHFFPSTTGMHAFFEPRFRAVYETGPHAFSTAFGLHHQEVIGLHDRRDATSIFTAWRNPPPDEWPRATHVLAGYNVRPRANIELSAEIYHKWLSGLYISEWTAFPRFSTKLQPASGRSSGLDLRAEWTGRNLYAYVNYGLSSVRYEAQQENLLLWYGTETLSFRPPHDRRHQVNALLGTQLGGVDLSIRWNYGSGLPYSRIVGFDGFVLMQGVSDLFSAGDEQRVIYTRPYDGVLPAYHRLDVSAERTFDLPALSLTAQAGIINVYNRSNLLSLDLFTLSRTDQLPFLPTFGLKVDVK
ncbi:MAG: TonB-dependent receptor [Bacteroidota bacterium]